MEDPAGPAVSLDAGRSRPWSGAVAIARQHPFAADSVLAITLFAISVTGMYTISHQTFQHFGSPNAFAVVLLGLMTFPLAWRRRVPGIVLFLTFVGMIPTLVLNVPDELGSLGPLVAMYSVASHCERRFAVRALLVSSFFMLPVFIAGMVVEEVQAPWPAVIGNYAIYITAWVLGDSVRIRRAYLRSLEQRAELAEQRRDEQAREAVAAERDRIARELHDVVAHSMAVMVVQAGAARRVLQSEPGRADQALRHVEETGREAMVEMRRMVGVLRDDAVLGDPSPQESRAPQPGLDGLPALVDHWQQAGLPTELEVEGHPRAVQAGVDLSAYRIVQEALTNTFKHAGPAHATVRVAYHEDGIELVVSDDGRGLAVRAEVAANGGGEVSLGHGLVGMRERVALVGGELRAGPRAGGGFEVAAHLPLAAAG